MLDIFLKENGNFINYHMEHALAFTACILFIVICLYIGKNYWNKRQQVVYIAIICGFGTFMQLFKLVYRSSIGVMDTAHDLPLHLCNLMTLIMPFILYYKWRNVWAITFFWIMAGCAQSIFTPTLTESMPHYEAVRYWAVHAVIILGALYGTYVYGWSLTWQDAIKSVISINVLALFLYPINVALEANYMYLNAKPPGKTFYDLLGPWPEYILTLEFVLVFAFGIVLLPFYINKIKPAYKFIKMD